MTGEASSGVVLIGVDAGATKTVALAVRLDGTTVGRASGGGANPKRQGLATAAERIASLCIEAGASDGVRSPALVFIAGAGLDRPDHGRALEHAVAGHLPATRVMAANDTLAVLRCGTPDGVGLVVPVSTGGNVIGRGPDGRVTDRGHGIFGGGFVLGALAARAAKRGRVSPELEAAIARADLTWTGRRPEARVAELAADVLRAAEAGDPYPLRIVDRWCGRVTRAVREESADLALGESPAVVVYGGLVGQSPWLEARIVEAVLEGAPGARPTHLTAEPVEGAALLARDAWAGRLGPWAFTPLR